MFTNMVKRLSVGFLWLVLLTAAPTAWASSDKKPSNQEAELVRQLDQNLKLETLQIPGAPLGSLNERGVFSAPANRSRPNGERIAIEFFRFSRLPSADEATPPIVILRGGPGYPGLGGAIDDPAFYNRSVRRFTQLSDIIIVGQRGFGSSGDTPCPLKSEVSFQEVDEEEERQARNRKAAVACRALYSKQGRDMSGYNIAEMADDVAEIATALGYDRVQLKGNSFGAFWAMTIIRRHPGMVERATLASLEGPDDTFDIPTDIVNSLKRIADGAAQADRYKSRFPTEGLITAYQIAIDKAEAEPFEVSHKTEDGSDVVMRIDGHAMRELSRGVRRPPLWSTIMYDWPHDLLRIIDGDFSEAARRIHRVWTGRGTDNAAEAIIECSSGASSARMERIRTDRARNFLSSTTPLWDDDICGVWGNAVQPMDTSSFVSSVPVVLIQGTWDISTPPENATGLRAIFPNNTFILVEGGSHGSIYEAEDADSNMPAALNHWYATGDPSLLPTQVKLSPLTWTEKDRE